MPCPNREKEKALVGCFTKYLEITGKFVDTSIDLCAGQDGSYLAEFLLDKGYTVHGIIRRSSSFNTGRISHLYDDPRSHRQVEVLELQTKISQSRRKPLPEPSPG